MEALWAGNALALFNSTAASVAARGLCNAAPTLLRNFSGLCSTGISSTDAKTSLGAGPGPSSLRLAQTTTSGASNANLRLFGLLLEARRGCRWLGELRPSSGSLQQTQLAPAPIATGVAPQSLADKPTELTVAMDAQVIFDACWRKFEEKYRLKSVHVPREVVWLNGAPGAGKGANTQHILKTRGLDHSICLSTLLVQNDATRGLIERGELVPDSLVGEVLLEALLVQSCQVPECGILVDGFPRTALQVDFLKLLHDKVQELHVSFAHTQHRNQFPRPLFKVVMLYVDEENSILRQLERAKLASVHNKRVLDAGAGQLWEQRATDLSIEKCKKRYEIFRQHHSAVLRLKQFFPFHLIDAMGSLAETQEAITTELRYQSSLDLSYETYAAIRHLPLARDVSQHARQQLVMRLDAHCEKYPDLFQRVIDLVTSEIMPLVHESGLAGKAEYVSDHRMFVENPRAAQMLIDVLTDRGYSVSHTTEISHVPVQVDMQTGHIKSRKEYLHKFHIAWDSKGVRDALKAMEMAVRMADPSSNSTTARISQSFIPAHALASSRGEQHQQQRMASAAAAAAAQGHAQRMGITPSLAPPYPPAGQFPGDQGFPGSSSSSSGGRCTGGAGQPGGTQGRPEGYDTVLQPFEPQERVASCS